MEYEDLWDCKWSIFLISIFFPPLTSTLCPSYQTLSPPLFGGLVDNPLYYVLDDTPFLSSIPP